MSRYFYGHDHSGVISIYRIFHPEIGKSYVGQTILEPQKRLYIHRAHSKLGKRYPRNYGLLQQDMERYGPKSFCVEVLATFPLGNQLMADLAEREWIIRLNALAPGGYNIDRGGLSGPGIRSTLGILIRLKETGVPKSARHKASIRAGILAYHARRRALSGTT